MKINDKMFINILKAPGDGGCISIMCCTCPTMLAHTKIEGRSSKRRVGVLKIHPRDVSQLSGVLYRSPDAPGLELGDDNLQGGN